MRKWLVILIIAAAGLGLLIKKLCQKPEHPDRIVRAIARQPRTNTSSAQLPTNEEMFRSAFLPILNGFFSRLQPLGSNGLRLPVVLPLGETSFANVRFIGESNRTCLFSVGDHSFGSAYILDQGGKRISGLNYFRRKGKDAAGLPRNINQIASASNGDEPFLAKFADVRQFPPRQTQEIGAMASQILHAVLPDFESLYTLKEVSQARVGAHALPFYTVTFLRRDQTVADPSNLIRDEIVIGLKSTTDGLELDSFEDVGAAYATEEGNPRWKLLRK